VQELKTDIIIFLLVSAVVAKHCWRTLEKCHNQSVPFGTPFDYLASLLRKVIIFETRKCKFNND